MEPSDLKRVKGLEAEIAQLKRMYAEVALRTLLPQVYGSAALTAAPRHVERTHSNHGKSNQVQRKLPHRRPFEPTSHLFVAQMAARRRLH